MTATQQNLIEKIEYIKGVLTQAQKDIEDNNLQGAGDCVFAAKLELQPVGKTISDLFNKKQ